MVKSTIIAGTKYYLPAVRLADTDFHRQVTETTICITFDVSRLLITWVGVSDKVYV